MIHSENFKETYPLLFSDEDYGKEQKSERYKSAWDEARKAAETLKNEFFAKRVLVFGSLVDINRFDERSDIDLAVVGVPEEKFYAAVGTITQLIVDFKIDLIDAENCKKSLYKAIERDGIEI